jgi:hypothetical protein
MAVAAIVAITIAGIAGVAAVEAMNKGYSNIAVNSGDKLFTASRNESTQETNKT